MAKETQRKIVFAATLFVLGSLASFACASFMGGARQDDDRPPIIVRGGSLHFENTTTKRPGKKWKQVTAGNKKEWELDHGNGKKVSFYQVYFFPAAGTSCAPVEGEEVVVDFDSDGNGSADRKYTIKIDNQRPVIVGTNDLDVDTSDPTRLIASRDGKMISVTVGSAVCTTATDVYVEPMK